MCTLRSLKNERFLKLVHKNHNNHNLEKYKLYTKNASRHMFRNNFEEQRSHSQMEQNVKKYNKQRQDTDALCELT